MGRNGWVLEEGSRRIFRPLLVVSVPWVSIESSLAAMIEVNPTGHDNDSISQPFKFYNKK